MAQTTHKDYYGGAWIEDTHKTLQFLTTINKRAGKQSCNTDQTDGAISVNRILAMIPFDVCKQSLFLDDCWAVRPRADGAKPFDAMIDLKGADAILALCNLLDRTACVSEAEGGKVEEPCPTLIVATKALLSILASNPQCTANINWTAIIDKSIQSILQHYRSHPAHQLAISKFITRELLAGWSLALASDLDDEGDEGGDAKRMRSAYTAVVQSVSECVEHINEDSPWIEGALCALDREEGGDGVVFDCREIVREAEPAEFRLEEIMLAWFMPTQSWLCLLSRLFALAGQQENSGKNAKKPVGGGGGGDDGNGKQPPSPPVKEVHADPIRKLKGLLKDTLHTHCTFLINCVGIEPYLCHNVRLILDIYKWIGAVDGSEREALLSILHSFEYFKNAHNFADIVVGFWRCLSDDDCLTMGALSASDDAAGGKNGAALPTVSYGGEEETTVAAGDAENDALVQELLDFKYKLIGNVKNVLLAISNPQRFPDYPQGGWWQDTLVSGGFTLGKLLGQLLDSDPLFCAGVVNNLSTEFPNPNLNPNLTGSSASSDQDAFALVMSSLSAGVGNEGISKIALSNLTTAYSRASSPTHAASILKQMCHVGSRGTGSMFNSVLDAAIEAFGRRIDDACLLECFLEIVEGVDGGGGGGGELRMQALLLTVLRLFVDKGLEYLQSSSPPADTPSAGNNGGLEKRQSVSNKTNAALTKYQQFTHLTIILKVIQACIHTLPPSHSTQTNKYTYTEPFQEFWFTALIIGYLPRLAWCAEWADDRDGGGSSLLLSEIAVYTPVLIKSRDRLQTPGSTFSKIVLANGNTGSSKAASSHTLTSTPSAALKRHLRGLMAGGGNGKKEGAAIPNDICKALNYPQCIWLLAIWQVESCKFHRGLFDNTPTYLQSEIVETLGLYSCLEAIFSGIIISCKHAQMSTQNTSPLAHLLLTTCLCHAHERTHKSALAFINQYFLDSFSFYGNVWVWRHVSSLLTHVFHGCRVGVGHYQSGGSSPSSCANENKNTIVNNSLTQDPTLSRQYLRDLLILARQIFSMASQKCPTLFYEFAREMMTRACDDGNGAGVADGCRCGDRNIVVLELLRLVAGGGSVDDDYVDIDCLLYRNGEDGLCHLSSPQSRGDGEDCSALNEESLRSILSGEWSAPKTKQALQCWSHLNDEQASSSLMITSLSHSLRTLARQHQARQTPCHRHPFQSKITFSPTSATTPEQSTANGNFAILMSWLSEMFWRDTARYHPSSASHTLLCLWGGLMETLLRWVVVLRADPPRRFEGMHVFHWALMILDVCREGGGGLVVDANSSAATANTRNDGGGLLYFYLQQCLYEQMMKFFCALPRFWGGADSKFVDEEFEIMKSLLFSLRNNYHCAEGGAYKSNAAELNKCLLALLQTEITDTIVFYSKKPAGLSRPMGDLAPTKELISKISAISYPLALKLAQTQTTATKKSPPFSPALIANQAWRMVGCSWLSTWSVINASGCFAESDWIYAGSLWGPEAILVFKTLGRPCFANFGMRSLEHLTLSLEDDSPETSKTALFFYIPQLVQSLRWDHYGIIKKCILHLAKHSTLFAHQIIWNAQANTHTDEDATIEDPQKTIFDAIILECTQQLSTSPHTLSLYQKQFEFFRKLCSVSATLKPLIKREKWERKQKIDEELAKIKVDPSSHVYLPTNPENTVVDIDYGSGRPLQSHAKAPYMATFYVGTSNANGCSRGAAADGKNKLNACARRASVDALLLDGNHHGDDGGVPIEKSASEDTATTKAQHSPPSHRTAAGSPQNIDRRDTIRKSVIFKVGDDCRQDVLALQLIAAIKQIIAHHKVTAYLHPYTVIATAPGCGVIEVIPNSLSRDQLGREQINSLPSYFSHRFVGGGGGEGAAGVDTPGPLHEARMCFCESMAAYSIVCYLLAIKDRHNGNIMIDEHGHIVHIDFGFILDIAPGGIGFEKAAFKLTPEMLQVMSGPVYLEYFRHLCTQTFLACRLYVDPLCALVNVMSSSGLPCFSGGGGGTTPRTVENLRARFRLDLGVEEARAFVDKLIEKSGGSLRTTWYDMYQQSTNGIPY